MQALGCEEWHEQDSAMDAARFVCNCHRRKIRADATSPFYTTDILKATALYNLKQASINCDLVGGLLGTWQASPALFLQDQTISKKGKVC